MNRFPVLFVSVFLVATTSCAQWYPYNTIDPASQHHGSIVTGDIDNDGDLDVVNGFLASSTNDVILMIHTYDHLNEKFNVATLTNPTPFSASYLELADLNGDGYLDIIATANNGSGSPSSTRFYFNDGTGAFADPTFFQSTFIYYSMLALDVDADDDVDLAILGTGGVIIYENDGQGVFTAWTPILTMGGMSQHRLERCDLDEDIFPDILVRGSAANSWLVQNPGLAPLVVQLSNSSGILLIDMDGDGRDDLVKRSSNALMVRYNTGGTVFGPSVLTNDLFLTNVSVVWHVLDFDHDGDQDVVVRTDDSGIDPFKVWLNNGDLTFTSVVLVQADREMRFCESFVVPWEHDGVRFLLAPCTNRIFRYLIMDGPTVKLLGSLTDHISNSALTFPIDMDMDGKLDLVVANMNESSLWWYPDIRNSTGEQRLLYRKNSLILDLGIADLDQDGLPDLVIKTESATRVQFNQGNGEFNFGPFFDQVGTIPFDLDGDGDMDLLESTTLLGQAPKIFRNQGNGQFTQVTLSLPLISSYQFRQVLDVDGNGLFDVVYNTGGTNQVWRNLGNFSFAAAIEMAEGIHVVPIDVDLDGDQDMVTVTLAGTDGTFLHRNISGSLLDAQAELIMANAICAGCRPDVIDLDKDGYPDLLFHGTQGSFLLMNDGQGNFGSPEPFLPGLEISYESEILDMDLDGDEDILFLDLSTFSAALVWIENFAVHPYSISGLVFGDLNGNGQQDGTETGIPLAALDVQPAGFIQFSEGTGAFTIPSDLGSHVVSVGLNSPCWAISSGSSYIDVDLTPDVPHVQGLLFGFTPILDSSLVQVTTEVASSTCNGVTTMWVNLLNLGTRGELATLEVELDENWTFISSEPAPVSNINGVLTWDPQPLGLFGNVSIAIQLQVPGVDHIGTELLDQFTVSSTDMGGQDGVVFTTSSSYVNDCAYDPNDKQVGPSGFGIFQALPLEVTEALTYTIRFQNTGSAPATRVMLRDQLDPALVAAGISMIGASHEVSEMYVEQDNELVVIFDPILLPDSATDMAGSQGYFKFRIPLAINVQHFTEIENTAAIYFDLNPPIITNTTNVLMVDCSFWTPEIMVDGDSLIATEGLAYQWYLNGQPLANAVERSVAIAETGTYTVSVTSIHGCINLSAEQLILSVGQGSSAEQHVVHVFPNPVSDQVTFINDIGLDPADTIELIDVLGAVHRVLNGNGSNKVEINTKALADGVYILRHIHQSRISGSWRIIKNSGSQ